MWLFSTSGGTDVCTAFVARLPAAAGLRGRDCSAARSAARSRPGTSTGNSVIDEVGELVITEPMPSMPLFLWGDEDRRSACARATSRCTRASGATATGSASPRAAAPSSTAARTRRSTARACAWARARSTARRRAVAGGARRARGRRARGDGRRAVDGAVRRAARGRAARRRARRADQAAHPRGLLAAPRAQRGAARSREVPRTLSGKVLEVPVKRILMGRRPSEAASIESLANPPSLDYFVDARGRTLSGWPAGRRALRPTGPSERPTISFMISFAPP